MRGAMFFTWLFVRPLRPNIGQVESLLKSSGLDRGASRVSVPEPGFSTLSRRRKSQEVKQCLYVSGKINIFISACLRLII